MTNHAASLVALSVAPLSGAADVALLGKLLLERLTVRKKKRIVLPTLSKRASPAKEVVNSALYDDILATIGRTARVMEKAPADFATLGEEALRQHILVQLNDQYGDSSAETFNSRGKTDILIQRDGETLFVAECKLWGGEKVFADAISQLLDLYVTWRDTQTAVIMFCRRKDFSRILSSIPDFAAKHPYFDSVIPDGGETSFRFLFKNPRDGQRKVNLTVLAFHLPPA